MSQTPADAGGSSAAPRPASQETVRAWPLQRASRHRARPQGPRDDRTNDHTPSNCRTERPQVRSCAGLRLPCSGTELERRLADTWRGLARHQTLFHPVEYVDTSHRILPGASQDRCYQLRTRKERHRDGDVRELPEATDRQMHSEHTGSSTGPWPVPQSVPPRSASP